jgi:hypothetical protein
VHLKELKQKPGGRSHRAVKPNCFEGPEAGDLSEKESEGEKECSWNTQNGDAPLAGRRSKLKSQEYNQNRP